MRLLQVVIRNLRAQMVNVMEADVTRDPLQNLREFVIRAAFYGCIDITPLFIMLVVRFFELMLYIEQPNAKHSRHHEDRSLNEQEGLPSDRPAQQCIQRNN